LFCCNKWLDFFLLYSTLLVLHLFLVRSFCLPFMGDVFFSFVPFFHGDSIVFRPLSFWLICRRQLFSTDRQGSVCVCGIYWEPVDSSPSDKVLSTGPDRDWWPLDSTSSSSAIVVPSVDSWEDPFSLSWSFWLFSLKIRSHLDGFNHIIHPFLKGDQLFCKNQKKLHYKQGKSKSQYNLATVREHF
jgi:hypothetical protein